MGNQQSQQKPFSTPGRTLGGGGGPAPAPAPAPAPTQRPPASKPAPAPAPTPAPNPTPAARPANNDAARAAAARAAEARAQATAAQTKGTGKLKPAATATAGREEERMVPPSPTPDALPRRRPPAPGPLPAPTPPPHSSPTPTAVSTPRYARSARPPLSLSDHLHSASSVPATIDRDLFAGSIAPAPRPPVRTLAAVAHPRPSRSSSTSDTCDLPPPPLATTLAARRRRRPPAPPRIVSHIMDHHHDKAQPPTSSPGALPWSRTVATTDHHARLGPTTTTTARYIRAVRWLLAPGSHIPHPSLPRRRRQTQSSLSTSSTIVVNLNLKPGSLPLVDIHHPSLPLLIVGVDPHRVMVKRPRAQPRQEACEEARCPPLRPRGLVPTLTTFMTFTIFMTSAFLSELSVSLVLSSSSSALRWSPSPTPSPPRSSTLNTRQVHAGSSLPQD
ncbi:hypothetical protein AURDEDRAFT_163133 [Auricularia subglabra TFB-10046 SS5]|nr:hypothetical protein AURDEDRAFT_163133 [Auricularia subglabra TFB-10046 SS5]